MFLYHLFPATAGVSPVPCSPRSCCPAVLPNRPVVRFLAPLRLVCACGMLFFALLFAFPLVAQETSTGWKKYENNPVLGGKLGTCFDITMLQEDGLFKMWFSWRPKDSLAYTESKDGIHWTPPVIVLAPIKKHVWEAGINRPSLVKKDGVYHLWFTGQDRPKNKTSAIGYATSTDGIHFVRKSDKPVLVAEKGWEKEIAVMCPHVEWDAKEKLFKMWYSGGENYEPNSIGYATSPDGFTWTKHPKNPIFVADKKNKWEQHKITGAQIMQKDGWYYMFYIGFENEHLARIGIARSRDGINNWERMKTNPIVSPGKNTWDASACYKPFVIYDAKEKKYRLWYNGRHNAPEQIGLVIHDGEDLGVFGDDDTKTTLLNPEQFKHYIDTFNADDNETVKQFYPNDAAWDFLSKNIPFLDYPDKDIERTYYFRWWTYRKHIKKTKNRGFVVTEFHNAVPWAGKENTISCAAGHHFREGRWL